MHLVNTMAYTGSAPWHGLGNKLDRNQPISVWQTQAGMNWEIKETPVLFDSSQDENHLINLRSHESHKVLYRSDNFEALSVVSDRYKVVQPKEVLGFYKDLVAVGGYELETAGVLKGGRKLWALANLGKETVLKGDDKIKAYLLLATSCDGTMATTAQFTSIRVVCNNTLQMAVGEKNGAVKVPHSTIFDPYAVKSKLGIGISAWETFMASIHAMSDTKINRFDSMDFLISILGNPKLPMHKQPNQKAIQHALQLFTGSGQGASLTSSKGTVWGLLNSVTEYVDTHRRAMNQDNRLDSAWFGVGATIKEKAFQNAILLSNRN
jgi:phage/plasmid-like protein (TIGR03299 family)